MHKFQKCANLLQMDGLSANKSFSKTQLSKIVQSGGFISGSLNEFISPDLFDPSKELMRLASSIADGC